MHLKIHPTILNTSNKKSRANVSAVAVFLFIFFSLFNSYTACVFIPDNLTTVENIYHHHLSIRKIFLKSYSCLIVWSLRLTSKIIFFFCFWQAYSKQTEHLYFIICLCVEILFLSFPLLFLLTFEFSLNIFLYACLHFTLAKEIKKKFFLFTSVSQLENREVA